MSPPLNRSCARRTSLFINPHPPPPHHKKALVRPENGAHFTGGNSLHSPHPLPRKDFSPWRYWPERSASGRCSFGCFFHPFFFRSWPNDHLSCFEIELIIFLTLQIVWTNMWQEIVPQKDLHSILRQCLNNRRRRSWQRQDKFTSKDSAKVL